MFFLHLLLKIEPVPIFFTVLYWKLNTPVLWKHLFFYLFFSNLSSEISTAFGLWDKNTLLSLKLMGYWSAYFSFLCNSSCRLWSWRWTRGPIRSWPLARTCSCRGGKIKVKFANVHINPHAVSCCKTCRQALALSLHTAGYRSVYIAAFRPIRYPPQRTVGEATKPLTFPIVTLLLTFRLLLTVL